MIRFNFLSFALTSVKRGLLQAVTLPKRQGFWQRLYAVPRIAPFETHHQRYEAWFGKHEAAYVSELLALRAFVPWEGRGIEIGVGSGRFARPLGVQVGLDPSHAMLAYAATR